MPKYQHERGANHGRRCCFCGRRAGGLLFGRFGLCRKCWRAGVEKTLVPCPSCEASGHIKAMDEEEQRDGRCAACQPATR